MTELGKPLQKRSDKQIQEKTEYKCQIAASELKIRNEKMKFDSNKKLCLTKYNDKTYVKQKTTIGLGKSLGKKFDLKIYNKSKKSK